MRSLSAVLVVLAPHAQAAVYTVGSGQQYPNLPALFNAVDLEPGDVVEVRGGETYAGGIVMRGADAGGNDSGASGSAASDRCCRAVSTPSSSARPNTWSSKVSKWSG
jgi:hypothetical protein